MNPEKSKLKIMIANDFGVSIEDRLEGELKAANELAGAALALRQASKKVPLEWCAKVAESFEKGEIKDGMEGHHIAQLIKKYLIRAGDYLSHLADVEQQKANTQFGRAAGLQEAVKMMKKIQDEENERLQGLLSVSDDTLRTASSIAKAEHGTAIERKQAAVEEKKKKIAKKKNSKKKSSKKKVKYE